MELFHYPPELFDLLVDTIPKLCKSKKSLLTFFEGAGVPSVDLAAFQKLLKETPDDFGKYEVTRELLQKLNQSGERGLGPRRAIIKRVTEFEDFSVCWEQDRPAARGLVAQVRDVVNVKDSFTRMQQERESERKGRLAESEGKRAAAAAQTAKIAGVRTRLFALFGETDAKKRGKALEEVLNDLFAAHGILVREAFTIRGPCGEGVIEQIDGLIEFEGTLYFVEMKWWATPLGAGDVSQHVVRIFGRGGQVRGLFISYSDFTDSALLTCREAMTQGKVVVLSRLEEIVRLLESGGDLRVWIKGKVNALLVDKNPYFTGAK